jgi:hypothetical protein
LYTSLSVESRIESRLRELRTTVSFLAALDGISNTRLNQALRGHKPLDTKDGIRLNDLTLRLIELQDAMRPLPISFQNVEEVRGLLAVTKKPEEIREIISKLFQ